MILFICVNVYKRPFILDSLIEAYPPRWIEHNEIGRYFCRFAWSHYVPNMVLARLYPHDQAILDTLRPTFLHSGHSAFSAKILL